MRQPMCPNYYKQETFGEHWMVLRLLKVRIRHVSAWPFAIIMLIEY